LILNFPENGIIGNLPTGPKAWGKVSENQDFSGQ
jgi:hypothetical protein